jgi:hypothetical protein
MIAVSRLCQSPRWFESSGLRVTTGLLFGMTSLGESACALQLSTQIAEAWNGQAYTGSARHETDVERFASLANKWRDDTQFLSSTTEIATHPAYQGIIGMGKPVLPLILVDLRDHGGQWYWALKAISNEDPVVPADRGFVKKMKAAWLNWGLRKGLI